MKRLLQRALTLGRHQLAQRHLRQRLALYGLTVSVLHRFTAQQLADIATALNQLGAIDGDQNTHDHWRRLRAPCISGCRDGVEAVGTLIRNGIVKPNRCGPDGDALLHAVVRSGIAFVPGSGCVLLNYVSVAERIRLLVSLGADPDHANTFGDIPLQLAWQRETELGNRAAVALLEAGCNPMKRDCTGLTLLHRAARSNNLAVLRGWCHAGLHTHPTGGLRDGQALLQTPLMCAVMAGHRDSVDVLIDRERRAIQSGKARLIEGYRRMEQELQRAGSRVEKMAAGQRVVAQGRDMLANARASLNFSDSYGATALHWAIDYAHPELADLLLACGADPGARAGRVESSSWTCTQLAAAHAQLKPGRPILLLLLKYGVRPDRPYYMVDQTGWGRERTGLC